MKTAGLITLLGCCSLAACGGKAAGTAAPDPSVEASSPDGTVANGSSGEAEGDASGDATTDATREGDNASSGDGATSDAGQAGDGATAPACCPALEPPPGTPCVDPGLPSYSCEYPVDGGAGCTRRDACWLGQFQREPTTCFVPPGPGCPATQADVPVGQSCTAANACAYPGAVCECSNRAADGGPVSTDGGAPTWRCTAVDPTCPPLQPLNGTVPCSRVGGPRCIYGQVAPTCFTCVCGGWQALPCLAMQ